jgi:hypothetical protein
MLYDTLEILLACIFGKRPSALHFYYTYAAVFKGI